jgi:hypothetical protein
MHPGFIAWWRHHHRHGCESWADWARHVDSGPGTCGPTGAHHGPPWRSAPFDDDVSAGFGVRRPLRFLAHKLELDDAQLARVATILAALKTERAQAAVDQRRRLAALADALEATTFDEAKLGEAGAAEAVSAERLRAAVTTALRQIHDTLREDQRRRLAYLLRTGALTI